MLNMYNYLTHILCIAKIFQQLNTMYIQLTSDTYCDISRHCWQIVTLGLAFKHGLIISRRDRECENAPRWYGPIVCTKRLFRVVTYMTAISLPRYSSQRVTAAWCTRQGNLVIKKPNYEVIHLKHENINSVIHQCWFLLVWILIKY